MKFRYKLPIWFFVFLIALSVAEAATIVYFVLKMFNLAGLMSASLIVEITMTIICLLGLVFSLFMLNLHYKISDINLELKLGFFDLLKKQVLISKICNVVYKKNEDLVLMSYISNTLDPIIMIVAINSSKADKFATTLKSLNPKVIYTTE